MEFTHLTAGQDDDGRRLDVLIRRLLPGQPLSHVYGALRKGLVTVDGKKRKQDFRVRAGSDIAVANMLMGADNGAERNATPLPEHLVLFRNDDLLIVNKPYDIPVQTTRHGGRSLADMVRDDFAFFHKDSDSLSFRCGPLHRLDRKTTGIVVFSQSLRGARWFSDALQAHRIQKTYLALVQGTVETEQLWEDAVAKKDTVSKNFYTVAVGEHGKNALTSIKPLAVGSYNGVPVTLVQCRITTGRKHQIRAQAAAHGFPLLGDTAYGGRRGATAQDFFLHAHHLAFGENPCAVPVEIRAEIPPAFAEMLRECLINFSTPL